MKKWYRQLGMILALVLFLSNGSLYSVYAAETGDTVKSDMEEEQDEAVEKDSEETDSDGEDVPEEGEEIEDKDTGKLEESKEGDKETVSETTQYSTVKKVQAAEEEDPYAAEKSGLENSWRYQNGELIPQKLRYIEYSTWPKDADAVAYGIDVSHHNGTIDWAKAKKAGVDYAIIRCGYGMDQTDQDDSKWADNVKGCIENDIPFGVYIYSYADTTARAKSEAQHVLRLVKGYDLDYPIYFDMEEDSLLTKLSKKQLGDIAEAFCDTIEAAGYEVGVYANTNWFTNYLTDSRFDQWERWVAQYNTSCEYTGDYSMWQCSSKGKVDGISGYVDLNVDYGAGIGITGFVQDSETQEWYYFISGKKATDVSSVIKGTVNGEKAWWHVVDGQVTFDNTVAKNENGWWVIRNGKVDFSYTGFAENSNGWWYCEEGEVRFGVDDVIKGKVKNKSGWWVVRDGEVDFTYTGYAENKNGWWYCEEGEVQFGVDDVIKGKVKNKSGWWVVRDGEVDFSYTGYAENKNGWWYCEEGIVQFGVNDVIKGKVEKETAWWHVVDGQVIFDNTVAKNKNGWWVIRNGKVDFTYTGYAENSNGWWYCEEGEVQFGVNDILKGNVKNKSGWWVVRDGQVDFTYAGYAENKNGWWYCEKGEVQFGVDDVIKGKVKNETAWWHVADGQVTFDNTVAKNKNGWWVIRGGKVDFSYTGYAENSNGWWYCEKGEVQFGVDDVIKGKVKNETAWWYVIDGQVRFDDTVAKNKNGWWVIRGGKVDFSFDGIAANSKGKWLCESGKVNFEYTGTYVWEGITYKIIDGKVS